MAGYSSGSLVAVRPFVHRSDGDDVVIGDAERQVYLSIPAEGLDILNALAEGKTVGETVRLFEAKHAETPDMDDFLAALEAEGFVAANSDGADAPAGHQHKLLKRWSFDWISPVIARRLSGWPTLVVGLAMIAAGITMIVNDPGLVPGPRVLLFEDGNFAAMLWTTFVISVIGVSIHEFAHAIAARSVGASASLGISNLMYVLVAQTDISGVWMASKAQRLKAMLAGLFVDAALGSLLVGLVYAIRHDYVAVPMAVKVLASSALLTFLVRMLFQFFLYLRTDIYYVVATALNCRNLMADTERLLRNLLARITFRKHRVEDQSAVPRNERRKVRGFAVLYVLGRLFSLSALFFAILPVLWGYVEQFYLLIIGQPTRFESIDFVALALLALLINGGGLTLWCRSLVKGFLRRRRALRTAP